MTFGPGQGRGCRWFNANPCSSGAEWRKVRRKVTKVIEILHKIKRWLPSNMSKYKINRQCPDNYAQPAKKSVSVAVSGVFVSAQNFYQTLQLSLLHFPPLHCGKIQLSLLIIFMIISFEPGCNFRLLALARGIKETGCKYVYPLKRIQNFDQASRNFGQVEMNGAPLATGLRVTHLIGFKAEINLCTQTKSSLVPVRQKLFAGPQFDLIGIWHSGRLRIRNVQVNQGSFKLTSRRPSVNDSLARSRWMLSRPYVDKIALQIFLDVT